MNLASNYVCKKAYEHLLKDGCAIGLVVRRADGTLEELPLFRHSRSSDLLCYGIPELEEGESLGLEYLIDGEMVTVKLEFHGTDLLASLPPGFLSGLADAGMTQIGGASFQSLTPSEGPGDNVVDAEQYDPQSKGTANATFLFYVPKGTQAEADPVKSDDADNGGTKSEKKQTYLILRIASPEGYERDRSRESVKTNTQFRPLSELQTDSYVEV